MHCAECSLLLQEYSEETRRLERAISEYRLAVTSGILIEIDAAKRLVAEVRAAVDLARNTFQDHKSSHRSRHSDRPTAFFANGRTTHRA